jgi:hypothetical protein
MGGGKSVEAWAIETLTFNQVQAAARLGIMALRPRFPALPLSLPIVAQKTQTEMNRSGFSHFGQRIHAPTLPHPDISHCGMNEGGMKIRVHQ